MHPKIKEFWTKKRHHELVGPSFIDSWEVYIGEGLIRKIETVAHGNRYRYENEWYTEEEMLRLIEQKAFL